MSSRQESNVVPLLGASLDPETQKWLELERQRQSRLDEVLAHMVQADEVRGIAILSHRNLHEQFVQLNLTRSISTEDIFTIGHSLVERFPSSRERGTVDDTHAQVITPPTSQRSNKLTSKAFYGIATTLDETYFHAGQLSEGCAVSTWSIPHYGSVYRIRQSDYLIMVSDKVLADADGPKNKDGTITVRRHALYDDTQGMFSSLTHAYCELSLREYNQNKNVE